MDQPQLKPVLPDYANCGLNVAASVLRHFGAQTAQAGHPAVDALLAQREYKNIVLMLFDGLGTYTLKDHLDPAGFLRAHTARQMSAVFPPTTVAATTSIESGLAPCEHAWLGWSLYLEEMDRIVDVFTDTDSVTGEHLPGPVRAVDRLLPYRNIVERLNGTGRVRAQIISKHGDTHVDTLEELLEKTKERCAAPGRQYIYTYYNEPDHSMHDLGMLAVGDLVRQIERQVEALCASLDDDTLVLVTADHGLIDAEQAPLEQFFELTAALERPFHIEARAAGFFVRPAYRGIFPALVKQALGDRDFWTVSAEEAIALGLFGRGAEHPRFRRLIGDYLVIATGSRSLCMQRDPHPMVAMHAGLTPREMTVPLIVAHS